MDYLIKKGRISTKKGRISTKKRRFFPKTWIVIVVLRRFLLKGERMRNSKTHTSATFKKKLPKCSTIFYAYNDLQRKYGELISKREDVIEFKANVKLEKFPLGESFTTDFLITTTSGTEIREIIYRNQLFKKSKLEQLSASRAYWREKGITNWGIVVDAETRTN